MMTLLNIRLIRVLLLSGALFFCWPMPEAKAIDPVTMAILAPIALKLAESAKPYILRGAVNTVNHFGRIGLDVCHIFLLPFGCLECSVGMPFGLFRNGVRHIVKGGIAPVRLIYHILVLPLAMVGLQIN